MTATDRDQIGTLRAIKSEWLRAIVGIRRRGRKARASAEETDAALIKQLDALARRIAAKEFKRVGGKVIEQGAIEHGGSGQDVVAGTSSE